MRLWRRREPLLSVVVPVYDVAAWLPACLDSLLDATHHNLEIVVVDDGSPDGSGVIADSYAAQDERVTVVHTTNHGLGAARNEGLRHVSGDFIAFCDSDDVVPKTAYSTMLAGLTRSGSDFVTGSIVRWESDGLHEPPWMSRLHAADGGFRISVDDHPEILGDVFAWNKLFRRDFWEASALAWPEGVRYEDQPTTTRAYLLGQFDVIPDVVYHWRIRSDGSSITQQRSTLQDLSDRMLTKRMSWASVCDHGSPRVTEAFLDRVLPGDLHRYFVEVPGCTDEWWELLRAGVLEFWGARSLAHSGLPPVHRLAGWLIEQDRRADVVALMEYLTGLAGAPVARILDDGVWRLDIPHDVVDPATVDADAVALRPHEL